MIPPVADHLSVTIRKYTVKDYDLQFLVDRDALSQPASAFLWAAAQATTTTLFSGPPGAGKTTLLSAFLRAAPNDKCVRVCEEVRELHVPLVHGSFYEASPPTLEGSRRYSLRDLVKVVLAQRPDLICVGEVRGAEALVNRLRRPRVAPRGVSPRLDERGLVSKLFRRTCFRLRCVGA